MGVSVALLAASGRIEPSKELIQKRLCQLRLSYSVAFIAHFTGVTRGSVHRWLLMQCRPKRSSAAFIITMSELPDRYIRKIVKARQNLADAGYVDRTNRKRVKPLPVAAPAPPADDFCI